MWLDAWFAIRSAGAMLAAMAHHATSPGRWQERARSSCDIAFVPNCTGPTATQQPGSSSRPRAKTANKIHPDKLMKIDFLQRRNRQGNGAGAGAYYHPRLRIVQIPDRARDARRRRAAATPWGNGGQVPCTARNLMTVVRTGSGQGGLRLVSDRAATSTGPSAAVISPGPKPRCAFGVRKVGSVAAVAMIQQNLNTVVLHRLFAAPPLPPPRPRTDRPQ